MDNTEESFVILYHNNNNGYLGWLGIVTCCGMDDWVSISGRNRVLSLRHHAQTGSGAHPVSYLVDTGGKVAGA
jgi:hypothetical protein